MKKLLALLMALTLALTLCACKGDDAADTPAPSDSPAAEDTSSPEPSEAPAIDADLTQPLYRFASGLPEDAVVGTVNGAPVTADLYLYQIDSACEQLAMYGITDFSDGEMAGYIRDDAENALRYYASLTSLCAANGIELTAAVLAELNDQFEEDLTLQGMTREQFLQLVGLSEDSLFAIYASSWRYESLMEALVGPPSQAELEAYGEDNGVFSCKHILLLTVDEDQTAEDGTVTSADDYNAAQKALAEELLARIQAEGDTAEELLDQLAAQYSEDPGLAAYPDGYTFDASSGLVDGYREGTLALAVGETGLVETSYGYHIIMRLPPDLSDYVTGWQQEQLYSTVQAEMDAADVQLTDEALSVDLTGFYARAAAYREALAAEIYPES